MVALQHTATIIWPTARQIILMARDLCGRAAPVRSPRGSLKISCCGGLLALASLNVFAGDVAVLAAQFDDAGGGRWSASVTLEHADTGWEHYADAWRVVGEGGDVYGTRTLYHPHESEQPFTRSLAGIVIPKSVGTVYVEAHDKVHGWAQQRLQIDLTKARNGTIQVPR